MRWRFTLLFFACFFSYVKAQTYLDPSASPDARAEDLLQRMTVQEKLDYIGGTNSFYIRAIDRLGIPEIKMSDGPVGVRTWGPTTAFPAGILNAATWNRDLVHQLGVALGKDARARGVHILLAPGVDIYRSPLCGRNFEYFGEDPYLSGQMAVQYIDGVQSMGVVATVKHFVANNQEYDRYNVSSDVDERTLQEIYLPAFKAAVKQAHVGAVMTAYNLLNGVHCTQNNHLQNEILKGEWGFDGFVMSDWGATHDGLAAAQGGLDLEMPAGDNMNATNLLPLLNNGTLSEQVIDDKVRRILRVLFRFGFFDRNQTDSSYPLNNPDNDSVALNLARQGMVLLQNKDSILPLNENKISTIAVVGPNANSFLAGGGSSYPTPFSYTSFYQGIVNLVGKNVTVRLDNSSMTPVSIADSSVFYTDSAATQRGLTGSYYLNMDLSGTPNQIRTDNTVDFYWGNGVPNVTGFPASNYSIRWTGYIKPVQSGNYNFIVAGDDGYRLSVGGEQLINDWQDQALTTNKVSKYLEADKVYPVELDYYQNGGVAQISFGWQFGQSMYTSAVEKATGADVAIVCVGFNANSEGEGFDRPFQLPDNQDSLINAVAKVNPNTIVVLSAGGNVDMSSWLPNVKGLIHTWYPGQEGGKALAEILFGITDPSGKLPATFEKKWSDNPVYNNYYDNGTGHVAYNEKLMVGYRYYDTKNVEPQFPFGFGLSYTSFAFSNLKISGDTTGQSTHVSVSFDIKNVGSVYGGEVAQVYVSQPNAPVMRPEKELKGFSKVFLNPGETQTVIVQLDSSSFAYYRDSKKGFGMDYGTFKILVGASSRDIRLVDSIKFNNPTGVKPLIISYYPANNSQLASTWQTFSIKFNSGVYFESGKKIVIRDASNDAIVDSMTSVGGTETDSITFQNSSEFKLGETYYIEIDSDAFVDYFNHKYDGLYGNDKWRFTVTQTPVKRASRNVSFAVFPVPAKNRIHFSVSDDSKGIKNIEIFNETGRLIDLIRVQNKETIIPFDCSTLNDGIYFCKYISEGIPIVRKFIVYR